MSKENHHEQNISLNKSDDNNKLTDVPSLDVKIEDKQLFKNILVTKRQYK